MDALIYCWRDNRLVDIVLLSETASDPAPTQTELELVRMCKEWKELKAGLRKTTEQLEMNLSEAGKRIVETLQLQPYDDERYATYSKDTQGEVYPKSHVGLARVIRRILTEHGLVEDSKAEILKLNKQIDSMHDAGLGPDYTDKVVRELQTENAQLIKDAIDKLYPGKYYHDPHCNVSREEPMGCAGCSCTMYKRVLVAERFVCPFQRPEFTETNKGDLQAEVKRLRECLSEYVLPQTADLLALENGRIQRNSTGVPIPVCPETRILQELRRCVESALRGETAEGKEDEQS